MRRTMTLALVTLAAAASLLWSTTVEAGIQANTVGATATLLGQGHAVRGTVLLQCTAGEQVQVTLTLTQGSRIGTGHGAGVCTGELTAYPVTVPAGGDRFTAGAARACATAVDRDHGQVVATRQWCRAADVLLVAP